MAEELSPIVFRKSPEAITSYDFIDYSNGVGYEIYYGILHTNGSYAFTINTDFYSEEIVTYAQSVNGNTALTFDVTFNIPKNLKGDILLDIPIACLGLDTIARAYTMYVTGEAYHYDGSTETQLGSTATGKTYSGSVDSDGTITHVTKVAALKINQATVKHFKKGETLRIKIIFYYTSISANTYFVIGHDPANRTATSVTNYPPFATNQSMTITKLQVLVPFVISL